MVIQLNGHDLPGVWCNPAPDHPQPYENVHVGIGRRDVPIHLFRGDALETTWRVEVRPVLEQEGLVDFRGDLVQGKRGERFLYLNWGTVGTDGRFHLFRRAKVMLSAIDPGVVREALNTGGELHCSIGLTDSKGNPTCAPLAPPFVTWNVVTQTAIPTTTGG